MKDIPFRWLPLLLTIALAATLWFVTFYLNWSTFWIKISLSSLTLAALSLVLQKDRGVWGRFDLKSVFLGVASAIVLYFIFMLGRVVSMQVFPFSESQIGGIYSRGEGTPLWVIAALLFFVTGPSEELYWRGYLQRRLMGRFGGWKGWLLGTTVYAGVHIWAFNFILVGAAAVAGAFWGCMYWRLGNLAPVIISHAIWSAVVFTLLPLQ